MGYGLPNRYGLWVMGEFGQFGREPTWWTQKVWVMGVYGLLQVWIKTEATALGLDLVIFIKLSFFLDFYF